MLRLRPIVLIVAFVASLLACGAPGTRGDPSPLLGPYAAARSGLAPSVRAPLAPVPDTRADALMFREPRRLCELRGSRGSC